MKIFKSIVCILLCMVTLAAFVVPTYAAISGSAEDCDEWTYVGKVTTHKKKTTTASFTQTKGTLYYDGWNLFAPQKTMNTYGAYTIRIVDNHGFETKVYWKYKKNYTLKFPAKGRTYEIYIKPYQPETVFEQRASKSAKAQTVQNNSWKKAPSWKYTGYTNWFW